MLHTIIKRGFYQDSVALMLLSGKLSSLEGVNKVSIMMASPANKTIFAQSGLSTPELEAAAANDMAIVADVSHPEILDTLLAEVEVYIKNQASGSVAGEHAETVRTWKSALAQLPDANLALLSIPGTYAAFETEKALDAGLNVFLFSDNVSLDDEVRLKKMAHEKGLVLMGPDCGTGIIQGLPLAFTNQVKKGGIGIVGASGTGIQELTTIIDRLGEGVTNAVGTGGRDLSSQVGGITMLDSINAMEESPEVKVLLVASKPPAEAVRKRISERLAACKKPVVTLFLGERPEIEEEGFYHAYTLDEAARTAVSLLRGEAPLPFVAVMPEVDCFRAEEEKTIRAYYSGGTLAAEAAMLIKDALNLHPSAKEAEGFMLRQQGHVVIDLGDDAYTQGRPHPMIDPAKRIDCLTEAADSLETGVILFDVVLGYGSHEDMAGALLPAISTLRKKAEKDGRRLFFVTSVCGTRNDPQDYDLQVKKLTEAGVFVCETNRIAVETALHLIGHRLNLPKKALVPRQPAKETDGAVSEPLRALLSEMPRCINLGLKSFGEVIAGLGAKVVQFDWTPPAGGDTEMIRMLQFLHSFRFADREEGFHEV